MTEHEPKPTKTIYLKRQPLTDEVRAKLCAEAERTGVGAMRLLRGAREKPSGLNAAIVVSWLSGPVKSAVPAHVDYVLARWAALPTNKRIPLTDEMCAEMDSEFARTGVGPVQLWQHATDVPEGLTDQLIQAWTIGSARPETVLEGYWSYVMAQLRSLPDGDARMSKSGRVARRYVTKIDTTMLDEIRLHRERTGIGAGILLRRAANKPAGLTPSMVSGWLSGNTKKADPQIVEYVLACYRAWP